MKATFFSYTFRNNTSQPIGSGGFDSIFIYSRELLKQAATFSVIEMHAVTEQFHAVHYTPNPFIDHTLIPFIVNAYGAPITLCIYDVEETPVDEKQKKGAYAINYPAKLKPVVYNYPLIPGNRFQVIKMILQGDGEKQL